MRLRELDHAGALGTYVPINCQWLRSCKTIDPLHKVTAIGCALVTDSVYDSELLGSQVLEFVNHDSAEVCRVEVRDALVTENQLGKSWQIIIGEASFFLSEPFQFKCSDISESFKFSFDRCVAERLLLCLTKRILDRSSVIPGGVALAELLANPVVLRKA